MEVAKTNTSSFNDIIKYFEVAILSRFNKDNKALKDFQIKCNSTNVDYLLSLDIDRSIKMKQLRTMYLSEDEIKKVREELVDLNKDYVVYEFNKVGGKENSTHHKKGGCIRKIEFYKQPFTLDIHIYFRASVAPYNLYYDLIMLNELFNTLGINDNHPVNELYTYTFHFEEVKGKLMQNFFYYISAGYYDNPDELLKHEYGRMMVDEYNKAEHATYHSTKRFWGKCNDAMERRRK